jgi:3-mercaptopyruvate sulfurtransferase SseA
MAKYSVRITRQIVFSTVVEVEAETEEQALDQADEMAAAADTDEVMSWDAGSPEHYSGAEIEDAPEHDNGNDKAANDEDEQEFA